MENHIYVKKIRESNFELLRIILMLMVLGVHYNNNSMGGLALSILHKGDLNYYIALFLNSSFAICVNGFLLITGYFMINSQKIEIRKAINLYILILFYGSVLYLVDCIIGGSKFDVKDLVIFALSSKWFINVYITLYLIAPFINIVLTRISKHTYRILLFILIILFSIYPTFIDCLSINIFYTTTSDKGYGIIQFILIYIMGGYIRLHYKSIKTIKFDFLIYLIISIIIFFFSIITTEVWNYNNILVILSSVFLFMAFSKMKLRYSKVLNIVSASTISVFIIHTDTPITKLWQNLFNVRKYCISNIYILHFVITIVGMFLICVVIDKIGRIVMSKTIDKYIDRIKLFNRVITVKTK